jgi:hypothetical protein
VDWFSAYRRQKSEDNPEIFGDSEEETHEVESPAVDDEVIDWNDPRCRSIPGQPRDYGNAPVPYQNVVDFSGRHVQSTAYYESYLYPGTRRGGRPRGRTCYDAFGNPL